MAIRNGAQLQWACRRGMLELDLVLGGFLANCYASLTLQQQQDFCDLLSCHDQDLFDWIIRRDIVTNSRFHVIVMMILHYATPNL